jgi:hypothetical protein
MDPKALERALRHRPGPAVFAAACAAGISTLEAWPDRERAVTFADEQYPEVPWWQGGDEPPWWGLVRTLHLYDAYVPPPPALSQQPHITRLGLHNLPEVIGTHPEALHNLLAAFSAVRRLDLSYPQLVVDRATAILSATAGQISELSVDESDLDGRGFAAILEASGPLRALSAQGNRLGAAGAAAAAHADSLEELELSRTELGPDGLEALAAVSWPRLRRLGLQSCDVDDAAGLLASLPGLVTLDLGGNWFPPETVAEVLGALPNLRNLALDDAWDQTSIEWLASSALPARLERLCVNGLRGFDGVGILARAKWPVLRALSLAWSDIGDEGLQRLAEVQWPALAALRLESNQISDLGGLLPALGCELRFLDLRSNPLSAGAIEGLLAHATSHPDLEIQLDLDDLAPDLAARVRAQWPLCESPLPERQWLEWW